MSGDTLLSMAGIAAAPTRPVLRWHGGKWRLAPWIIAHFPPHRVYVEPFGGAASVLLRKVRSYAEIYNDLDDEVVTLFRVLRDPARAAELVRLVRLTPFARSEFDLAFEATADPVERCRRLVVRSMFAGGTRGILDIDRANAGFNAGSARARADRPNASHAVDWSNYAEALPAIIERMRMVVVEQRPAIDVIAQHDSTATLFYVDPPYMAETRSARTNRIYRHEMTRDDHAALLKRLKGLAGMVVLSGYPDPLYEDVLCPGRARGRSHGESGPLDWRRVETKAFADGARERVEVLWINPQAQAALDAHALPLLAGAGGPGA